MVLPTISMGRLWIIYTNSDLDLLIEQNGIHMYSKEIHIDTIKIDFY
jgi:hypothetical protein